jgi:hypothetical protein
VGLTVLRKYQHLVLPNQTWKSETPCGLSLKTRFTIFFEVHSGLGMYGKTVYFMHGNDSFGFKTAYDFLHLRIRFNFWFPCSAFIAEFKGM